MALLLIDIQSFAEGSTPVLPLETHAISGYLLQQGIRHTLKIREPGNEKALREYADHYEITQVALLADRLSQEQLTGILDTLWEAGFRKTNAIALLRRCKEEEAAHWFDAGIHFICYTSFAAALTELINTLNIPLNPFLDQSQGLMFRNYFGNTVKNETIAAAWSTSWIKWETIDWQPWIQKIKEETGSFLVQVPVFWNGNSLTASDRYKYIREIKTHLLPDGFWWEGDFSGDIPADLPATLHFKPGNQLVYDANPAAFPWYLPEQVIKVKPRGKFGLILPGYKTLTTAEVVLLGNLIPGEWQAGQWENGQPAWIRKGIWSLEEKRYNPALQKQVRYLSSAWKYHAFLKKSRFFHPIEIIYATKMWYHRIALS